MGLVLLITAGTEAVTQDSVHVVVAATTDVHGRVYHWDYLNDREAPWGLTRVATVVDSLRAAYPGQVIVLDGAQVKTISDQKFHCRHLYSSLDHVGSFSASVESTN